MRLVASLLRWLVGTPLDRHHRTDDNNKVLLGTKRIFRVIYSDSYRQK